MTEGTLKSYQGCFNMKEGTLKSCQGCFNMKEGDHSPSCEGECIAQEVFKDAAGLMDKAQGNETEGSAMNRTVVNVMTHMIKKHKLDGKKKIYSYSANETLAFLLQRKRLV